MQTTQAATFAAYLTADTCCVVPFVMAYWPKAWHLDLSGVLHECPAQLVTQLSYSQKINKTKLSTNGHCSRSWFCIVAWVSSRIEHGSLAIAKGTSSYGDSRSEWNWCKVTCAWGMAKHAGPHPHKHHHAGSSGRGWFVCWFTGQEEEVSWADCWQMATLVACVLLICLKYYMTWTSMTSSMNRPWLTETGLVWAGWMLCLIICPVNTPCTCARVSCSSFRCNFRHVCTELDILSITR